tara:strand:- start:1039 stop:3468 length:2430 start_codon:yes stop_codon:yes gene_type:complete
MEKIDNYPQILGKNLKKCEASQKKSQREFHESLIDLGESFLFHNVGILFGEYKKANTIDEDIEKNFYKHNRTKQGQSTGTYVSYLRYLSSQMKESIISEKFEKSNTYESITNLISEFGYLDEVIKNGADENFEKLMDQKRKPSSANSSGVIDFFNAFITIRNINAHKEGKGGDRDWPLNDEYFSIINPLLYVALSDLVHDFDILKDYKPILVKSLDDKNKKGEFAIEVTKKQNKLEFKLSNQDLRFVSTDMRYLMDPDDNIYVKHYYSIIPQVDANQVKKIQDDEKAKEGAKFLGNLIDLHLSDDNKIDDNELLVLSQTAAASMITEDKLFKIIKDKIKELKIEGKVGTPDNKGDIFIKAKDSKTSLNFNPWWLHYLSLPKVDPKSFKKENNNMTFEERNKYFDNKVIELQNSKQSLTVVKKLDKINNTLKDLQKNKREAQNDDLTDYDSMISETIETLKDLSNQKKEKISELDKKIIKINNEKDDYVTFNKWAMHKNLWLEIDQYVESILSNHLNINVSSNSDETINQDLPWLNNTNYYQAGNLASYYWARIYREGSPLGSAYSIGYSFASGNKSGGKKFKYVPNNIHESLIEDLKKPLSVIWTTQTDTVSQKIDLDGSLNKKKNEIDTNLMNQYQDQLIDLGINIKCTPKGIDTGSDKVDWIMPIKEYLEVQDEYYITSLYSRFWPVDAYYSNGEIIPEMIYKYEKEVKTVLQLFSNVIDQLNDYALGLGINEETIKEKLDYYKRMKEIAFIEFKKEFPLGTPFTPTEKQRKVWEDHFLKDYGVNELSFKRIESDYRAETSDKKYKK